MTNRDLAEKIYKDLNKRGADLGNASIGIIRKTLDDNGVKNCSIPNISDWVAVNESLPNHGEEVLTITEDNWYRITQFGSIGKGKFPSQITYWMRLPEPPCR